MSLQGCRVAPCWGQHKTQDELVWLACYPELTRSGCQSWIPAPGPPAPLLGSLPLEVGVTQGFGIWGGVRMPTGGTGTWSHRRGSVGIPRRTRSFLRAGPGPCSPPAPALGLVCSRMEMNTHTHLYLRMPLGDSPASGRGREGAERAERLTWASQALGSHKLTCWISPSARPGLQQSRSRRLRGGWLRGTEIPLPSTSSLFHLTLPPRGLFPALTRENCPRTWL